MDVRHWQQFGLAIREPLGTRRSLALRAMAVATRVIGDAGRTTIIALLDMAAERRRPACRHGAHDASFDVAKMTGARLPKRFAMAAEDIRHLQSCSHGTRSAGWHDVQTEPIEWARRVADRFGGDACVACRACEACMAEQDLNDAHVRPAFQEMGRERVAERVHCYLLAQARRRAS